MKIKIIEIPEDHHRGGCNCCNRGILNKENNTQVIYPYDKIYRILLPGIEIRLCDDCLKTLKDALRGSGK